MVKAHIVTQFGFEYSHSVDENTTEELTTRHCHDAYEILLVTQGHGRYLIEGAEFELRPRTLVLIRPMEYHCVEVEPTSVYERYVIRFSQRSLVSEAREIIDKLADESNGESGNFFSSEAISQMLLSTFERFELTDGIKDSDRDTYFKLLLSELVLLLSSAENQRIAHNEGELGAKVTRYINDYLDKNISLDIIAKRFFVSKYYLCRCFKKYSGVSIHYYITYKRVLYAKQLIDSGETASGAAYKVGFGDYSAFYRAYVKVLGKPPTSK